MTLYVFKFLFVVCFLLSLALLWRLDWFPVLAPWEIRSKRERDWGRSPFMFLAIHTSRRWGEGLLHDCVFPGLRTDLPRSQDRGIGNRAIMYLAGCLLYLWRTVK